jgi:methionine-rich copper-binding protein CopC
MLASLLALAVSAGPAAAHAKLESMIPADGSIQATPPTKVVLTFDEPVGSTGAQVRVTSPKGADVADGAISVVQNVVTQPVGGLVDVGTYTVTARIVSADGHPITVTGSFTTRQAGPAAVERTAVSATTDGVSAALIVALVLAFLAVLSLIVAGVRRAPS